MKKKTSKTGMYALFILVGIMCVYLVAAQITPSLNLNGQNRFTISNYSQIQNVYYTSNDENDIATKINLAEANGGGVVVLPKGIINITKTIMLKSNVHIKGQGEDITILNTTSEIAIVLSDASIETEVFLSAHHNSSDVISNFSLTDMTILANNLSSGITLRRGGYGEVARIKLDSTNQRSIYVTGSTGSYNFIHDIRINSPLTSGIYLDTSHKNIITDIYISNTRENDGLLIRQSDYNQLSNIIIENTGISSDGSYGNGIRIIDGGNYNSFSNIEMKNILLVGITINSDSNFFNNIYMENCGTGGLYFNEAHNNAAQNININNCTSPISIGGAEYNSVIGATILNIPAGSAQVINNFIDTPTAPDYNNIQGITAFCLSASTEPYEIDGNNNVISNSIFSGCGAEDDNGINNSFTGNRGIDNKIHETSYFYKTVNFMKNIFIDNTDGILAIPLYIKNNQNIQSLKIDIEEFNGSSSNSGAIQQYFNSGTGSGFYQRYSGTGTGFFIDYRSAGSAHAVQIMDTNAVSHSGSLLRLTSDSSSTGNALSFNTDGNTTSIDIDSESKTTPAINIQDILSNISIQLSSGDKICYDSSCTIFSNNIDSNIPTNWTSIKNYPVACPAGSYITQLDDSVTCTAVSAIPNNLNMTLKNITNINYACFDESCAVYLRYNGTCIVSSNDAGATCI
jgi:hypothetical protein